ncbi:MAG: hypothetical protein AB7T06_40680 [Kofleriaceae bacterium]
MSTTDEDDDDKLPQRRKPLIAGSGWLLFVCAFLPTLRVCGDPVAPYQFPPDYVVYLGAAVLAVIAVLRSVRARRAWFTAWYVMWFATAITWACMFLAEASEIAALLLIGGGLVGVVVTAMSFHNQKYTARAMWTGGIIHGALSIVWYLLLASDGGAVWGAYVGLASSFAFTAASGIALSQHTAELARKRRESEPVPLPVARVVER